jgi:DegV family protein with EDD domain
MSQIAILTDSSANLTPDLIARYSIRVIPMKIHWSGQTYRDGVDITPSEFYARLEQETEIPTTSQLSIPELIQVYTELAPQCEAIVAPLISSGISGTVDAARSAAAEFSLVPVKIVDSLTAASAQALVVLAAAKAAQAGKNADQVVQETQTVARRLSVYFMVDTLKFLHKGGRIGTAARYLGTALNFKPILHMDEHGKIDALERVRTHHKALERLVELAIEKAGGAPAHVGILHANALESAEFIQRELTQRMQIEEIYTFELSPVIGAHVGPGTAGVAVYTDENLK